MIPVPYLTTPKLTDAIVQQLQTSLHELSWLEYVFPICEINEDDEGNTYPACYLEDGTTEYQSIMPDDTVRAFSFFVDNLFDRGRDGELNTYNLTLYVWARLDAIQSNANDFTMSLVNDVLGKLEDNECFNMATTLRSPFSEFSMLDQFDKSNIKRKRTGFRIDFSIYGDSNGCQLYEDQYGFTGSKSSDSDSGKLGQVSFDDDYGYICVVAGSPGNATWKKFPIAKT